MTVQLIFAVVILSLVAAVVGEEVMARRRQRRTEPYRIKDAWSR